MSNIKLKELIQTRGIHVPFDDILNTLKSEYKLAYEKYKLGNAIYRGTTNEYSYVIDPKSATRVSKNTRNFYTVLIDVLPSWKDWPKRSQSIVCSSSYKTARTYSSHVPHVVFPENGAKIGVCSKSDFWNSFPYVHSRLSPTNYFNMSEFTRQFHQFFEIANINVDVYNKTNVNTFFEISNSTLPSYDIIRQLVTENWRHLRDLLDDLKLHFKGDWLSYFNELLDPEKNNLKLITLESYNNTFYNREIWTDAKSLMVYSSDIDKISELARYNAQQQR
jgi:hypothetical protein